MIEGEAGFIDELRFSLRKRQKAIKHQVRAIESERLIDRSDEGDLTGISVQCALWVPRTTIRLSAWDDRWVWFDARQGSKEGWRWFYTHEGRIFGEESGRRLVAGLEASFGAAHNAAQGSRMSFASIWEPLLAQGPKEISVV